MIEIILTNADSKKPMHLNADKFVMWYEYEYEEFKYTQIRTDDEVFGVIESPEQISRIMYEEREKWMR